MAIKRDTVILNGSTPTKGTELAGDFDWFALEWLPVFDSGLIVSSNWDSMPLVAIQEDNSKPLCAPTPVEIGAVVQQKFSKLVLSLPSDVNATGTYRVDVLRGHGRYIRPNAGVRTGRFTVAPRDMYRPGTKGQNVNAVQGTTVICAVAANPRGLLIQGGSLTAQGDGALDGGAFLYADTGAATFLIHGLACDKSAGALVLPIPTIELPAGLGLNLILTSTKDRAIMNGAVL